MINFFLKSESFASPHAIMSCLLACRNDSKIAAFFTLLATIFSLFECNWSTTFPKVKHSSCCLN